MAESGLPPPLPPQMAVTERMISPARTPAAIAALPHTLWKVIFPSRTAASTATMLSSLSRRKSPILRRLSGVSTGTTPVNTCSGPTFLELARKLSALESISRPRNFSSSERSSRISLVRASARVSSSSGLALSRSESVMSKRVLFSMNLSVSWPVMASIRRTPLATENSLTMRSEPTFAVLSRCVPPQNSTE